MEDKLHQTATSHFSCDGQLSHEEGHSRLPLPPPCREQHDGISNNGENKEDPQSYQLLSLKGVVEGPPLLSFRYCSESHCCSAKDRRIRRLLGPVGHWAVLCEAGRHGSGGGKPGCSCTCSRGRVSSPLWSGAVAAAPHLSCLPRLPLELG